MAQYQKSPQAKRVAFALEHNSSSKPDSLLGSVTETSSTRNPEYVTFESQAPSERKSPARRKASGPSPNVPRSKRKSPHRSPSRQMFNRQSPGKQLRQSPKQNRGPFRYPKSPGLRRKGSEPSARTSLRQLKASGSPRSRRPSLLQSRKLSRLSKRSEMQSKKTSRNTSRKTSKKTSRKPTKTSSKTSPKVKTILKTYKKAAKSPVAKKFGVVPIIRESSADADLKNEVAEFLNTIPTLSAGPASEKRIYSEQTEPDKTFCGNLRSLFTFFEHKIHDVRYSAEFNDVDLKKLWYNPMCKNDLRLKPGSLVMQRKIGSGSFGVVYCAVEQETNKRYAIKCVRKKVSNPEKGLKNQEKEFYVWRETSGHPNIISLYAAFETVRAYCFVMDYIKSGSLNRVLRKNKLSEEVIRKIAAQLAHAVHTVHALGCLHRDISCSNILITPSFDVRLSDFGISLVGLSAKTRCGSLAYMAPEVIACRTSGPGADWWSYGIVLFTLFEGMTPLSLYVKRWNIDLNRLSKQNRYEVARNATVPINPLLDRGKRLVLKDLFRDEPAARLGVRDKMSFQPFKDHEYFQGFNWTELDNALIRLLKHRSKVPFI